MSAKTSLEERFQASGGKQPYVRRVFGRIARIYDLMNHLMSFGLDRHWRSVAARALALGNGAIGLDLGTGTADLAIAVLRRSGPDTRMIGMDITPEMLAEGRRKIEHLGLQERIDLRVGDAEQIDLPDSSVDGCCSAFMVRNLSDIRQGFAQMLRVVRPGGRMVCLEISHPPGPIFAALFHLYFYRLAPLFGTLLGRAGEEYTYLPHSLTVFPDAPALKAIMEEVGWAEVRFSLLHGGMVSVHVGTRPVGAA